ncbi:MAG: polysaccharide biosynthesis C-terminal domain-containing protein, partial [Saprospiraceae bacterium]
AGPIISKSFNDNNHEEIQSIYIKGSINSLIVGMLIFLGIWFNLDAIISLSSKPEAFFGATQIFLFLGIAKLIDGLTGINTHILLYSKYYKFNLLFLLCLGVLNVFLNLVLIKQYDIAGAAMATLISLTLYNLIKLFFIKFTLDMSPFTLDTLKVLLIGVMVFGLLFILPMPDSVVLGILLRSILISVLFIGSIYWSKASIDFNSLVDKYTKIIIR